MALIHFYEKPGCGNNTRQKNLLQEAGHELIVHNLLETRWRAEELRLFFGGRPVSEWFNRAAPRVKSGEIDPEAVDGPTALALMLEDPLLIRRPLMQVSERREAGFDVERVHEWIGLSPSGDAPEAEADLESCRRPHHCPPPADSLAADLQRILAYHERTKHRLDRYAAGPETLDWSAQPDPFRQFDGAAKIMLPLLADRLPTRFSDLHQPGAVPTHVLSLDAIGLLLELSLALTAWKEYGPDRWSLRCNPSSGNLHPTEGYLICQGITGLQDGVYHYLSRDHVLELRARRIAEALPDGPPRLFIGLSSIHWREAWKYGERAFRYCQLDTGHALGALRYAAAALGWGMRLIPSARTEDIAEFLGLNRGADFSRAEAEEAELLLEVVVDPQVGFMTPTLDKLEWTGTANVLDPHPMYHWPVIDEVAEASRSLGAISPAPEPTDYPARTGLPPTTASSLIRQRRSAQRFDPRFELGLADFHGLLDALLPRSGAPWDVWALPPSLHPVLFVHRVEGLAPGLYALPRTASAETKLRAALREDFTWTRPAECPEHLPLFQLAAGGCVPATRTINCHQAIAADSAFALGMLAEFEDTLKDSPWRYRQLYWEAGLLGQVLYLEAEARGLRGTGIGCYFDDAFHELLGLSGKTFQSLYHFTVGSPLTDSRITTQAPYSENRA